MVCGVEKRVRPASMSYDITVTCVAFFHSELCLN